MALEGKIKADVGDIVLLSNRDTKTEAAGYVRTIGEDTICLSQDNPTLMWGLSVSNREYKLSDFTDYEILKKKEE